VRSLSEKTVETERVMGEKKKACDIEKSQKRRVARGSTETNIPCCRSEITPKRTVLYGEKREGRPAYSEVHLMAWGSRRPT